MYNILLADDDEISTFLFKKAIEKLDCPIRLEVAQNGNEALKYIEKMGVPHIILLDLNMPVLDGFEFLKELKAKEIIIPNIFIISTFVRQEGKDALEKLGCTNFVEKPINEEKLRLIIQSSRLSSENIYF